MKISNFSLGLLAIILLIGVISIEIYRGDIEDNKSIKCWNETNYEVFKITDDIRSSEELSNVFPSINNFTIYTAIRNEDYNKFVCSNLINRKHPEINNSFFIYSANFYTDKELEIFCTIEFFNVTKDHILVLENRINLHFSQEDFFLINTNAPYFNESLVFLKENKIFNLNPYWDVVLNVSYIKQQCGDKI